MPDTAALRLEAQRPEPVPPSPAQLLEGVAAGQRWAHAALYDMLYPVVARTLQKILPDAASEYEDLVQTTFERIVRTLVGQHATRVQNLAGWAGAIAAHVALDALRRRVRERKLFAAEEPSPSLCELSPALDAERRVETRQQLAWLQGALARMNPDQARTVLLHDVLGHDLAEIAAIMNVTVAAAQRRLSRGHAELLRRAARRARGAR